MPDMFKSSPTKKNFVFTIIDDTDDATLENTKPIYDFLHEKGIYITKTVWVYPPRDKHSAGDSLQRSEYLEFIKDIQEKGFEIGLHNVGSGSFSRREVLKGLEEFKEKLGQYPKIHINHSYNPDSIYGGDKRFNRPFNWIVRKMYPQYSGVFQGEIAGSDFYWGDKHKEIIQFNRNHEFDGLNTIKHDKYMPYIDPNRSDFTNYYFSATFAPNQWVFNHIVTPGAIKKLEKENGICIIFTHLGYFMKNGKIDPGFVERINWLSANPNGLYKPVSFVLNEIVETRKSNGQAPYPKIPTSAKFRMEFQHLLTRVKYRKLVKLDDYAFKNLNKEMFVNKK
jgi:hypothetical protein